MIAVLIAGAVGMLVSLAGTRALISFFQRLIVYYLFLPK